MENLMEKYDINIYYEKIFSWKHKNINIEDLNDIIYEDDSIKIKFNLIEKINSKEEIYISKKGYFTEKDIINIIFSYYNGNLNPNELTDIKNKFEIKENLETRKDLLFITRTLHFKGLYKKNNIYHILIE